MKLLALLLVAAAAPAVEAGAKANSCLLQMDCFDVTMEVVDTSVCGAGGGARRLDLGIHTENATSRELSTGTASPCDWKVCMVWNFDKPGCVKDSADTMTNVCTRPTDYCADAYDFTTGTLTSKPGNGHTECVVVGEGAGATFLVRDQKCNSDFINIYSVDGVDESFCGQATDLGSIESCTTKNGANKECFWQFRTPSCPATEAPTDDIDPGPPPLPDDDLDPIFLNPTAGPTEPSAGPTSSPSAGPTSSPSAGPTGSPSAGPTGSPSAGPTQSSAGPTQSSAGPTQSSAGPTQSSAGPTSSPSAGPTSSPSAGPTSSPSAGPTGSPSAGPTQSSAGPTQSSAGPTQSSAGPTGSPSAGPTQSSAGPTQSSAGPTQSSAGPSAGPTSSPSAGPTSSPSAEPSSEPSAGPTKTPTVDDTPGPSDSPTDYFYWIRNAPPPEVSCVCVDYFNIPADGSYKISNLQYPGGIEVQIRQRVYRHGAYYNEAAVVTLGSERFEVTADGYYVDGLEVSLPTTVGGYGITAPAYSDGRLVAELDLGPYGLQFTHFNGGDNLHLRVASV